MTSSSAALYAVDSDDTEDEDYCGPPVVHMPFGPRYYSSLRQSGLPTLKPVIIDGLLRQGDKMLLAGASKSSKTTALVGLSVAISEGIEWLGWKCAKAPVLFVNLEVDTAALLHRLEEVYKAYGVNEPDPQSLAVWNLRGQSATMDRLSHDLIYYSKKMGASAIVIDPLYKVLEGDENSAEAVGRFCNQLDAVATETGCAVIYSHHHSKGNQASKRSMDRASGSGVFARDADALLDFIELDAPGDDPVLRIEGTLRYFRAFEPRFVRFCYPLHVVDQELSTLTARGERRKGPSSEERRKQRVQTMATETETAFEASKNAEGLATLKDMAEYLSKTQRAVRTRVENHGGFVIVDAKVSRSEVGEVSEVFTSKSQ